MQKGARKFVNTTFGYNLFGHFNLWEENILEKSLGQQELFV
jgi:hypothetical protein